MKPSSVVLYLLSVGCLGQHGRAFSLQCMTDSRGWPLSIRVNSGKIHHSSLMHSSKGQNASDLSWPSQLRPQELSRRALFVGLAFIGTSVIAHPVGATAPPQSSNVFADKNMSIDDAKKRFQNARQDLKYLVEHYTEICNNGKGDAVRNYLGTQGVNSNLYGIQKVLKILTEASEDIVEYTEAMEDFNAYYYQADGAAYQSLFVEHSSAKGTPELFLATAKQDIVQMQHCMDQLARQLNL